MDESVKLMKRFVEIGHDASFTGCRVFEYFVRKNGRSKLVSYEGDYTHISMIDIIYNFIVWNCRNVDQIIKSKQFIQSLAHISAYRSD